MLSKRKYEKNPIYSLQSTKFQTEEEARKEFLRIYRQLRYGHDTQLKKHGNDADFEELSAVMCISKYDGHLVDKVIVPASEKGGHKYKITRKECLGKCSVNHEVDLHMHVYCVGTGASAIISKIKSMKNKTYGRKAWTSRTRPRNEGLPYSYVFNQAVSNGFRTVGHPKEYPEKEYIVIH